MKTKISFVVIVFILISTLTWILRSQSLQVGYIAPFSGAEINRGVAVHKGLMVAIDDWNKKAGFFNSQIQVHLSDSQGMIAEVEKSAEQLINDKKVKILVGEVEDLRSKKLIDYALEKKQPLIVPVNLKNQISDNQGVFLNQNEMQQYGVVLSAFIETVLKLNHVVVLRNTSFDPENTIGQELKKAFATNSDRQIEEFLFESKNITQAVFYKELLKVERPILVLFSYPQESALMATSLRKQGYKGAIVMISGFENLNIRSVGGADILGTYYLSLFTPDSNEETSQDFVKKYESLHKQKPNTYAALGYDSGMMLINFVQSNLFGINSEKIIQQIEELKKDNQFRSSFLTQARVFRIDAKEDTIAYPKK